MPPSVKPFVSLCHPIMGAAAAIAAVASIAAGLSKMKLFGNAFVFCRHILWPSHDTRRLSFLVFLSIPLLTQTQQSSRDELFEWIVLNTSNESIRITKQQSTLSHAYIHSHSHAHEYIFIAELICKGGRTSTLCSLLALTDLDEVFLSESNETDFTVFAPSNQAFDRLGADTVAFLLQPSQSATLTDIVLFHVSDEGAFNSTDLDCTSLLSMLNGKDSRTKCIGTSKYQSGGGNTPDSQPAIVIPDVEACNGMVHIVDNVMLP